MHATATRARMGPPAIWPASRTIHVPARWVGKVKNFVYSFSLFSSNITYSKDWHFVRFHQYVDSRVIFNVLTAEGEFSSQKDPAISSISLDLKALEIENIFGKRDLAKGLLDKL